MRQRLALSLIFAAVMQLCTATAALAQKDPPPSCQSTLAAADEGGIDWSAPQSGFTSLQYVDGVKIKSPADLRAAISAAKRKVMFISGGDFSGWNFAALTFPVNAICFNGSNMTRSKWDGGSYYGLGFIATDLESASFKTTKLHAVLLRSPNLKNADMTAAQLGKGVFNGGWDGSIENWNLTDADMRGFRFDCSITVSDGCPLDRTGVKFLRTNLTGADIGSYLLWGGGDYTGAILNSTRIAPEQIAELAGANLVGPVLLGYDDKAVELSPADMGALQTQIALSKTLRANASFPCAKASTKIEMIICGEYAEDLRTADREMAALYSVARAKSPAAVAAQNMWLAKRNACADQECLTKSYETRIGILLGQIGDLGIIKPGESALFVADSVPLPDAFRRDPLFAKMRPALVAASGSQIVLTRAKNGSYSVVGGALGANAHSCSANGEGLRLDNKTGYYGGVPASETSETKAANKFTPAFQLNGDILRIFAGGHADYETYPDAYASCGARAYFGDMRRMDAPAAEVENMRKDLSNY